MQSSPELVTLASTASPDLIPSRILSALAASASESKEVIGDILKHVAKKYRYRLPDATGRKDIEYYRDPAHRGYLSYTMKEGESPSLFFKVPGEVKDRKKQSARRDAAKASADNKLF
jgi:large subunit ribosomal protein L15